MALEKTYCSDTLCIHMPGEAIGYLRVGPCEGTPAQQMIDVFSLHTYRKVFFCKDSPSIDINISHTVMLVVPISFIKHELYNELACNGVVLTVVKNLPQ